ncbi:DUF3199 family protein [Bacillus mobilis]|uniref:protein YqbG n=1 Tax=Bacillus mobilis TaxID=2026190 RepID=UPI0021D1AC06|nr:DUF3199 family protein [Bacillus mobilis]MCU5196494.1 DUF3199 family protein [Bacillus mobilis]
MTIISPERLVAYTIFDEVKRRDPKLLQMDIVEAQNDIFSLTFVDFQDKSKYPTVPEEVEIACCKLAQYHALVNSDEASVEDVQSQRMGNYSEQTNGYIKPDVRSLLFKWIKDKKKQGTVALRLRRV